MRVHRSRYLKDIMQLLFSNFKSRIKFFLRYLQLNTSIIQNDKNIIVRGEREGGTFCNIEKIDIVLPSSS